jgi:hypothetical protein
MITIICGKPGSGKTSFLAAKAVESMTSGASARLSACHNEIYLLNEGGFNLSYPENHITYTDFPVVSDVRGYPRLPSFDISLSRFSLPTDEDTEDNRPMFIPPYSVVFFDEAARVLNSRDWQDLAASMRVRFETHRHVGLDIYMTVHNGVEIDKCLRILADKVIELQGVRIRREKKFNRVRVVSIIWEALVFDDISHYSAYLDNPLKKRLAYSVSYSFDGDIFSCYDSYAFYVNHYRNNYDRDFEMVESVFVDKTVSDIKLYNDTHPLKNKVKELKKNAKT